MKLQTYNEMIEARATKNEALTAIKMFNVLQPSLKVSRSTGRILTLYGDKTLLGWYRTIKDIVSKEPGIV